MSKNVFYLCNSERPWLANLSWSRCHVPRVAAYRKLQRTWHRTRVTSRKENTWYNLISFFFFFNRKSLFVSEICKFLELDCAPIFYDSFYGNLHNVALFVLCSDICKGKTHSASFHFSSRPPYVCYTSWGYLAQFSSHSSDSMETGKHINMG